jgi:uncharacterized membrane protein
MASSRPAEPPTGDEPAPSDEPDDAPKRIAAHARVVRQIRLWTRVSFVLVGALPWWLPLARRYLPAEPVWLLLDWLFVPVCHRLPSRTLVLAGVAMPLCSRCAGIFAGLATGALVPWPRLELRAARFALALAGSLMLLDVVAQELGWHPLWHSTRIATGVLLGHLMACTLFAAIGRERRAA